MTLLDARGIDTMQQGEYLIERVLPAQGVSMVYGRSGSTKSFWVLDMGLCVATGRKWNGYGVRRGPVVYVAGEGASGCKLRRRAWMQQHSVRDIPHFYLRPEPVRLWRNKESVDELRADVNGADVRPALVVFDTLATCLGGADENSNGNMRELLDSAEELGREWDAAILLVHHVGKADGAKDPRGAQSLQDGVAMSAHLMGNVRTAGGGVGYGHGVLTCTKQKDGDLFEPIRRELHRLDLGGGDTSLSYGDSADVGASATKRRVSWEEIRQAMARYEMPIKPSTLALLLQWDRKAAQKALDRAAALGKVYKPNPDSDEYALTPTLTPGEGLAHVLTLVG